MTPETILLVDDEPDLRAALRESLQEDGYAVEEAEGADRALALLEQAHFPVIVTDFHMPGGPSGLDLLAAVKARDPRTLCVLITGYASLPMAVEALKRGAYDFVQKPFKVAELEAVLDRALDHARTLRQVEAYQKELEARVVARVAEFKAFHDESLQLNELLCQSLLATDEAAAVAPFLEHLRQRWTPAGMALLMPRGEGWLPLVQDGPRPWSAARPLPPPGGLELREWDGWYPDGFLVPLRAQKHLQACLVLGFETRSTFQPEAPAFVLWVRQVAAALHALRRLKAFASAEVARALGRA